MSNQYKYEIYQGSHSPGNQGNFRGKYFDEKSGKMTLFCKLLQKMLISCIFCQIIKDIVNSCYTADNLELG